MRASYFNDPRIRFIAFKEDPVRDNRPDMFDKMRQLVHHVATLDPNDGYIFKFDQDDILHKDAVEYMLNTRDPNYDKGAHQMVCTGAIWNQEILSGLIFSPTRLRHLVGLVWLATMTRDQVELG